MHIKFKYKLLIALFSVLIVTALSISSIWYTHSKKMTTEIMLNSMALLLNERGRALGKILEDIDYQSRLLAVNNPNVDRCLQNKWKNEHLNTQANKKLDQYINDIYTSNPLIQSIELGNYKGDVFVRGRRMGYKFIQDEKINKLIETYPKKIVVLPYYDSSLAIKEIKFFRDIEYYEKSIGYCSISISKETIEEIFEEVFPEKTIITLQNETNQLLYSSKNYSEVSNNQRLLENVRETEKKNEIIKDDYGKEWLCMGKTVSNMKLLINIAMPMEAILIDIKSKFQDIMYITLAMMILLLILVYGVSRGIGRNIFLLIEGLQGFSRGDLDTRVIINSKDEFSGLAEAFNNMTKDIKQLLEDIKTKEKEKMALEIRALQGQINLHFLFNTLNTIKNLCYIQRVTNVEQLVGAFMELLHISMENGNDYISLKDEITYIQHYLEIYKYKSVYPIQCYMDISDSIKEATILKFMLQPIVENAIIHGLEVGDGDREGLIFIKAIKDGEDIEIAIMDNGKGFDTKKVSKFNGIGIANTDRRIKVHFGEAYGIRIESTPEVSTTVYVRIPFKEKYDD